MGRPTNDYKGNTIILRINEGLYGELKRASEKEGISLSGYARNILLDKFCNTKKNSKKSNVIQNDVGEETYQDLLRMCDLSGFTINRFMDYVTRMFNDGRIYVDGMILRTKGELDTSRLEDVCHRRNLNPQDVIDKMTDRILKG